MRTDLSSAIHNLTFARSAWAGMGLLLLLGSSAASAQNAAQGQISWSITIPHVDIDPRDMSTVRSFVELDALPMSLLVANETSSGITIDLDSLRQHMKVRVEPVEAEITWPEEFDLTRRGSNSQRVPWATGLLELLPGDQIVVSLSGRRIDAPRFNAGRYTVASRIDSPPGGRRGLNALHGTREWRFEIRPPANTRERSTMYKLEADRALAAGDRAAVLQAYALALENDPSDNGARYSLGVSYLGSGRYGEAIAAFEQVISSTPVGLRGNVASVLAQAHLLLGNEVNALAALRVDGAADAYARAELAKLKERMRIQK